MKTTIPSITECQSFYFARFNQNNDKTTKMKKNEKKNKNKKKIQNAKHTKSTKPRIVSQAGKRGGAHSSAEEKIYFYCQLTRNHATVRNDFIINF